MTPKDNQIKQTLNTTFNQEYSELFVNACIASCEEISKYLKNNLTKEDFIKSTTIGEGGDKLSKIDLFAESVFVKHLSKFGDIYSEESGFIKSKESEFLDSSFKDNIIIIDPIDGSENLFSNFPYYGSSIALKQIGSYRGAISIDDLSNGCNLVSFVYNLCSNSFVYKTPYSNNFSKNKNIYTHKPTMVMFERAYQYLDICNILTQNKIKFRGAGAVALSLANARSYLFFLFIGNRRVFDIEAGLHICDDLYIYSDDNILFVSAYKDMYDDILPQIKEAIKINKL